MRNLLLRGYAELKSGFLDSANIPLEMTMPGILNSYLSLAPLTPGPVRVTILLKRESPRLGWERRSVHMFFRVNAKMLLSQRMFTARLPLGSGALRELSISWIRIPSVFS